jgi:hypothetical protein
MVRWVAVWMVVLAAVAAVAGAAVAPGRVTWPVGPAVLSHLDGLGRAPSGRGPSVCADAFSDGRVLIAAGALDGSLTIRRLSPSGAPDRGFGTAGQVTLSPGLLAGAEPLALVAAPDGSAYLAFANGQVGTTQSVAVSHLLADGSMDEAYGANGMTTTSVTAFYSSQGVCGLGTLLTVQPDGKLLLFQSRFDGFGRVVRLLSDGREDPTLTHPVTEPVAAVLPDGRLVVIHCNDCVDYQARAAAPRPGPHLPPVTSIVVLRPDGSVDPDFNGGAPLMTVPYVSAVIARPDGTIDAFGDNQARIDGHGNTLLLQDIPLYDRGDYTVFPQAGGGYVVHSAFYSEGAVFKVDASLQRHGASVHYQEPVMGGDVWYYPSPIVSHTVFTSTGVLPERWLLPRSEGFFVVGDVSLYDARTDSQRDEIGVAALDGKSRLITSYGGPARPARIRVKVTRRHPRVVDVVVPRPGTILAQAWDAHNRQRAQVLQDALESGTVRVRLKSLPKTRPMGPIARYTITFRDLTGVNTTTTARVPSTR